MGEIRPKTCKGVGITWPPSAGTFPDCARENGLELKAGKRQAVAHDVQRPVVTMNQHGERTHEDGSSLDMPPPPRSGAPLAPQDDEDWKIAATSAAQGMGRVCAESGKAGTEIVVSRGETDPLVQELLKTQAAEQVMVDADPEEFPSFESLCDTIKEEDKAMAAGAAPSS